MIVNVDPYSTSFNETSDVMKFSALTKEILTVKVNNKDTVRAPAAVEEQEKEDVEQIVLVEEKVQRVVRMSMCPGGEEQDILYEGTSTYRLF